MIRRVDLLLEDVRKVTRNSDNSNTEASDSFRDEEFLRAFNDAQDRIQALISSKYPEVFVSENIIDVVSGTEEYSIGTRVFLNNRVFFVEYSQTGQAQDYQRLSSRRLFERNTDSGTPSFYLRREGKILLNPIPNRTGKIRINFEKELNDLDRRRASVNSTTGTPLTSISITTIGVSTKLTSLTIGDYICIVDKDGEILAKNIPVTSSTTTAITIPSHTLGSGESIPTGSFVVIGRDTTTHSSLADNLERYLMAFAEARIFELDSSPELSKSRFIEYKQIEGDILDSFADLNRDIENIPILDPSLFEL